jgi:hypothetical protein
MLLMWKPVRLQGVGAASSIINANTQPAGKLDPWRRQVNCLFGLALNGQPYPANRARNPYDPTHGTTPARLTGLLHGGPNNPQVDRCRWKPLSAGTPRSTATWPSCCRSRP